MSQFQSNWFCDLARLAETWWETTHSQNLNQLDHDEVFKSS